VGNFGDEPAEQLIGISDIGRVYNISFKESMDIATFGGEEDFEVFACGDEVFKGS
jgi:hypothetical protein